MQFFVSMQSSIRSFQTHYVICSRTSRHLALHSFPTRRSSDLITLDARYQLHAYAKSGITSATPNEAELEAAHQTTIRSEEHTSELQSHSDIVCRLLLEKRNGRSRHWGRRLSLTWKRSAPHLFD